MIRGEVGTSITDICRLNLHYNKYFVRFGTTLPEREDEFINLTFKQVDKEIFELYEEYLTKGMWFSYTSANILIMERGY